MAADPIGDEIAAVLDGLAAIGVPGTDDPASIWALVAGHEVAALVDRPTELHLNLGQTLYLTLVVWVCSRGPEWHADRRLRPVLPEVLRVLHPRDAVTPGTWRGVGDQELPAYRIESLRAVKPLTGV